MADAGPIDLIVKKNYMNKITNWITKLKNEKINIENEKIQMILI